MKCPIHDEELKPTERQDWGGNILQRHYCHLCWNNYRTGQITWEEYKKRIRDYKK